MFKTYKDNLIAVDVFNVLVLIVCRVQKNCLFDLAICPLTCLSVPSNEKGCSIITSQKQIAIQDVYVDNRFKPSAVVVSSGHWCSGLARTDFHPLMVLSRCAPSFKQLAVNIAQAADCRDFVRHKQEEEVSRAAQKRKKEIAWGCVFVNLPPPHSCPRVRSSAGCCLHYLLSRATLWRAAEACTLNKKEEEKKGLCHVLFCSLLQVRGETALGNQKQHGLHVTKD